MSTEIPRRKKKGLLKYLSMETIHETGNSSSAPSIVAPLPFMISPSPRRNVHFWSTSSSESMTALDDITEDDDGDSRVFRHPSFSGSYSSHESK